MKGVAVFGSTGSVGTQALDVLAGLVGRYRVVGLAAGRNLPLLEQQIQLFHPDLFACGADAEPADVQRLTRDSHTHRASLEEIAAHAAVDILLVATSGIAGLPAALMALDHGKTVALANKEILVIAGALLQQAAVRGGGELRPVDSEHSAIWQCLWGERGRPERLILTASGGALRDLPLEALDRVSPREALQHPTWEMGPKITVDSATLLNKGLETIEARWLFDVPLERIEVVQHRESIVHSLVELADGSVKAQLGYPDMRLPIQCAITYPERLPVASSRRLDLVQVGCLSFEAIDEQRFPCLRLAMEAGRSGGTCPAVLVGADEVAVEQFLAGRLGFMDIPRLIETALSEHRAIAEPALEGILEAGDWARAWAEDWVSARGAQRTQAVL
ncbi:MAG TPA: 1-deoxy-D-xylulose-5-phosphate reductoisomerase [Dehalococcoidia bacterium]|nr:1-deoxy-D-xylulose-5-phosphate reductoisomerase [Dehalococcoidia bacterium]